VRAAAGALLGLSVLGSCSRAPEQHAAAPRAVVVEAGPPAEPATSTAGVDISWLVGTWERQSGAKEWLLFNAPKEVAVIAGKPPVMVARGEFVPSGKSISLFFRGAGGATQERVFEAAPDRSELHELSPTPGTYRRGAPP
jgi:hypothetical protein